MSYYCNSTPLTQYRTAERKYLQWLCTNQLEVLHPARMKSLTAFRALLINILILAMEEHKKSAALWSFLSSFSLLSFFYSTLTIFSRLMNFISNEQLLSEKKSFDKTYCPASNKTFRMHLSWELIEIKPESKRRLNNRLTLITWTQNGQLFAKTWGVFDDQEGAFVTYERGLKSKSRKESPKQDKPTGGYLWSLRVDRCLLSALIIIQPRFVAVAMMI